MAKKAYIGVDNVARKVKKGYIGVDNTARKIKKAYIGVGGVARPCWSGGELEPYGKITALTTARFFLSGLTIGNYAVFAGGSTDPNEYGSAEINAYNSNLVKTSPVQLGAERHTMGAATVGGYGIFAGGGISSGGACATACDVFNKSLARVGNITTYTLNYGRKELAGASVGDYALFAGGTKSYSATPVVETFNTSLTRGTASNLLQGDCTGLAGASVGNYALFMGTISSGGTYNTSAYGKSLTLKQAPNMSQNKRYIMGASVGDYAIFAGGYINSSGYPDNGVDAYNASLVKTRLSALNESRYSGAGASVGNYAVFAGGIASGSSYSRLVEAYNASLVKTNVFYLSDSRYGLAGASVGNYALFAGGFTGNYGNFYNTVDAYKVS